MKPSHMNIITLLFHYYEKLSDIFSFVLTKTKNKKKINTDYHACTVQARLISIYLICWAILGQMINYKVSIMYVRNISPASYVVNKITNLHRTFGIIIKYALSERNPFVNIFFAGVGKLKQGSDAYSEYTMDHRAAIRLNNCPGMEKSYLLMPPDAKRKNPSMESITLTESDGCRAVIWMTRVLGEPYSGQWHYITETMGNPGDNLICFLKMTSKKEIVSSIHTERH